MKFSIFIIPIFVSFIIIYGFIKKVNLYDEFINGAKEGLTMVIDIFPYIIGMVFAINIFTNSGFINYILAGSVKFLNIIKLPLEVVPMMILRPISGSATLVILNNILSTYGPDGYIGQLASTIQGCTDTTFYVITLYFGSVGISKIRYSLKVGLFSDLIGLIASVITVALFLKN